MSVNRKEVSVRVRFPKPVLSAAKKAARANGRSQNSEIVFQLSRVYGLLGPGTVASEPSS